jgi:hypothetical protein
MTIENKIERLKELVSQYETNEFLKFIAGILLQIPQRQSNPYFKKLKSPLRQLFFLALLNLQKISPGNKVGFSDTEWDEMATFLDEIEMKYFFLIGFPKGGKESIEEIEKIKVVMPTFMNYFFNGPLAYQEQEIEKIESIFSPFEADILQAYGCSISDLIGFYDLITEQININLNTATKFFNPKNWQAFTQSCIDKGLLDPKDWVKEAPEDMNAVFEFFKNPGSFLVVDINSMNTALPTEKLRKLFELFSCSPMPKNDSTYYTEENILFKRPILKTGETKYLIFYSKQLLNATYSHLFDFCKNLNQDKVLKSRDRFIEDKTLEIFKSFWGKDAFCYSSYRIDESDSEQDILLLFKETALIIEVKAAGYRAPMRDPIKAFDKLKADFKKNIQYGYEQTLRVKEKFLGEKKFKIKNYKGEVLYEVNPRKYKNVFSIIVTMERFGNIQTNLDDMLEVNDYDEFPWAVCIDDLEAFLLVLKKRSNKIQSLLTFLQYRQNFHGHLICGDELELCGLFLKKEKEFKDWSLRDEVIVTEADLTTPIEQAYLNGMGFKNERFLQEKRQKDSLFLYQQTK